MGQNYPPEFQEYILSRHSVQLVDVSLESIDARKLTDEFEDKYNFQLSVAKSCVIHDNRRSTGYLKVKVNAIAKESQDVHIEFEVTYKGQFRSSKELSEEELEEFTDTQIVPQLLPYARNVISTVSGMMSTMVNPLPTVLIPTMDIIQTLKNEKGSTRGGVKNDA